MQTDILAGLQKLKGWVFRSPAAGVVWPPPAVRTPPDLLRSNIRSVIIEVTSKCNLRCTYCYKADPAFDALPFVNTDLSDDALRYLYEYCKANGIREVSLSGVGETAIANGWHRRLSPFLDDEEIEVYLVSNLIRPLAPEDLAALCKLKVLQISFDSADPRVVRMMRSKARLSVIVDNIERLGRARSAASGDRPQLLVNCTLSRQNVGHIAALAELCRSLGVDELMIGEMMVNNPESALEPLSFLPPAEVSVLIRDVAAAARILKGAPTSLRIQQRLGFRFADLLDRDPVALSDPAAAEIFHRPSPASACSQPWDTPFIRSDGKVFPCCCHDNHFAALGDLAEQSLHDIYEGQRARDVRESILAGHPTLPCKGCTLASSLSFADFSADIAGRLTP